jgi:hypothetical protein
VVIQTDGQENASNKYTSAKIAEMINRQQKEYNWKFMFVGANEDAVLDATKNLGFTAGMTSVYDTKNTKQLYATMSNKASQLRCAVTADSVDLGYTTSERSLLNKD